MSAEFDRPTRAGATARPPAEERKAEVIDLDQDDRALLGKVIASQARLEKTQEDLEDAQKRLDSAWRTRSESFETSMRDLTMVSRHLQDGLKELSKFDDVIEELHSELADIRHATGKNSKRVSNVPKFVTLGIVLIEVMKGILHHYGIFG